MNTESYKLGAELDSFNHQQVQNDILAILEKGCNAVIDMTDCHYISSTGLRVLLYSKKTAAQKGLKISLMGINEEVKDIMDVTGFSNFFDYA
jgi:anti-anti-sigma factor